MTAFWSPNAKDYITAFFWFHNASNYMTAFWSPNAKDYITAFFWSHSASNYMTAFWSPNANNYMTAVWSLQCEQVVIAIILFWATKANTLIITIESPSAKT